MRSSLVAASFALIGCLVTACGAAPSSEGESSAESSAVAAAPTAPAGSSPASADAGTARVPQSLGGGGGGIIVHPPPLCGAPGQSCCAGNWCSVWSTCDYQTSNPFVSQCFSCGDVGQFHCSKGAPCKPGLTESYGFCTNTCGASGQRCCDGTSCNAGLVCNGDTTCATPPPPPPPPPPPTCGDYGQACCADGCHGGLACDNSNDCVYSCGYYGEACCSGGECFDGSSCGNDVFCGSK